MGYKKIYSEISKIYESDFTMDSLKELHDIASEVCIIRDKAMKKHKNDSIIRCNAIMLYLNEIAFTKLKEKLHFDDDMINRIIPCINYIEDVEDIYVFDGNIVIKMIENSNNVSIKFIPTSDFMDITSIAFDNSDNIEFKKNLVDSLNSDLDFVLNSHMSLRINENKIEYNNSNTNIYVNNNLQYIIDSNDNNHKATRIIIKYNDKFLYYDMKINNNKFIMSRNEYKVYSLSDMLNSNKVKVKK